MGSANSDRQYDWWGGKQRNTGIYQRNVNQYNKYRSNSNLYRNSGRAFLHGCNVPVSGNGKPNTGGNGHGFYHLQRNCLYSNPGQWD